MKIWWGKGERNEVFIMNFKEIHSNAEFLSTYRRARRFPLQGKCHEVTKGFAESQICSCRNKIKNTFIEKWLEHRVQAAFWHFPSFARRQYQRTAPARKIRNLSHFLEVSQRVEICNLTFSTRCSEETLLGIFSLLFHKGNI